MPSPTPLGIPAPPGLGEQNDDPLLQVLRKHLDGPFVKLYFDWGKDVRNNPDLYEKEDNLAKQKWMNSLRDAIRANLQDKQNQQ